MNTAKMLHDAHLRYQRDALYKQRTHAVDAVMPLNVVELRGLRCKPTASMLAMAQHANKLSASYYKLFCDHDVPRWQPCKTTLCRRTQSDADRFLAKLVTGGVL
jgi:hypothetical protein